MIYSYVQIVNVASGTEYLVIDVLKTWL